MIQEYLLRHDVNLFQMVLQAVRDAANEQRGYDSEQTLLALTACFKTANQQQSAPADFAYQEAFVACWNP